MIDGNSKDILYSKGQNDECYTFEYAVEPILKYIPKGVTVWCPFDKADSAFVRLISQTNPVVHSHIDEGQDFYTYEPEHWDIIVSNPPFTGKRRIVERALSFGKPFALILPNTWLNDSAPKQLFKNIPLELLMFEQRMEFDMKDGINKGITFSSSYFCNGVLPKQIIMESLNKPKKGTK